MVVFLSTSRKNSQAGAQRGTGLHRSSVDDYPKMNGHSPKASTSLVPNLLDLITVLVATKEAPPSLVCNAPSWCTSMYQLYHLPIWCLMVLAYFILLPS